MAGRRGSPKQAPLKRKGLERGPFHAMLWPAGSGYRWVRRGDADATLLEGEDEPGPWLVPIPPSADADLVRPRAALDVLDLHRALAKLRGDPERILTFANK